MVGIFARKYSGMVLLKIFNLERKEEK